MELASPVSDLMNRLNQNKFEAEDVETKIKFRT
jgi:hypothetical protein